MTDSSSVCVSDRAAEPVGKDSRGAEGRVTFRAISMVYRSPGPIYIGLCFVLRTLGLDIPGGPVFKNLPANAGDIG